MADQDNSIDLDAVNGRLGRDRLRWHQRRWMRRVGWRVAAVYEATGLDYTPSHPDAQRLAGRAIYWCPRPQRWHRQGWSVFYNQFGEVLGVWPARFGTPASAL